MGITSSNKELSRNQINCGDTFQITLSLSAEPDITTNPADIVLVLDRSGSMAGTALASLKVAAKEFIDIIDEATDGSQDGQIGGGSHIGIVSFAETARQDTQLITSVATLKTAVDGLTAAGNTNHRDAFEQALDLFDPASTNQKVMVMFTDGFTTAGGDPTPVATLAKEQGVTIYIIGLSGNGGIDEDALFEWASEPPEAFVAITPNAEELAELFENLARNITKPGATDIVIRDIISDCFRITSISSPTKGTATLVNNTTVEWRLDELGVNASEGAAFTFTVRHQGTCEGLIEVNRDIDYSDREGNVVVFPSPKIEVDCGIIITPEKCPEPVELAVDGCKDSIEFDAGELEMESLGRIVQLDVTVRNVCPNKRVALAVILTEIDDEGNEYKRGIKTMTIPAHTRATCQDITVRCIKFVLPEDLDVSGSVDAICDQRNFRARFISHYIDSDFECCGDIVP